MTTEATEQMKVVEWCRVTDWQHGKTTGLSRIFHIPNGGWRSKAEAAKLKAMGTLPGVSDLFLPVPIYAPNGLMSKAGLWIEMKAHGGRLSAEQDQWLADMREAGYEAICAVGAQEAIEAIKAYVGLEFGDAEELGDMEGSYVGL